MAQTPRELNVRRVADVSLPSADPVRPAGLAPNDHPHFLSERHSRDFDPQIRSHLHRPHVDCEVECCWWLGSAGDQAVWASGDGPSFDCTSLQLNLIRGDEGVQGYCTLLCFIDLLLTVGSTTGQGRGCSLV